MRKLILTLSTLVAISAYAETYQSIYNSIPQMPQVETIAKGEQATQAINNSYKELISKLDVIQAQESKEHGEYAKKTQEMHANHPKPTKKQQAALTAVGNDMSEILAASGLTPEQMSKMSDEQLAAVLMPLMANKIGLTPEEMQKLQGMSDKEAEAYIKGNQDRANRVQNSKFVQYSHDLEGMQPDKNITDADYAIIDQMHEIFDNLSSYDENAYKVEITPYDNSYEKMAEEYDERTTKILDELWERVSRESPQAGGNAIKMPAYGQSYYNRANAVIDEYNLAVTKKWLAVLDPKVNDARKKCIDKLAKYNKLVSLFNSLSSEDARIMAAGFRYPGISVYSEIFTYINLLQKRLEAPVKEHLTVPEYFGGMG